MTRIKFSTSVCLLGVLVSACAGGNAIEEGVPSAALGQFETAPLPPPAQPLLDGVDAPVGIQAATVSVPQATLPDTAGAASIPAVTPPPANALVTGAAVNTGTFPNSGIERNGATEQLSDEERDEKIAELRALQAQQQASTISPEANRARLLELQRLARTHSQDTIRTIEAQ